MHRRIAQQYLASAGGCSKTTISYAWISPTGNLHEMHGYEHGAWAEEYIKDHPGMLEKVGGFDTAGWEGVLLRLGWIQVTNARAMMVYEESTPPQAAWDAACEMVVGCVLARQMDPESETVWLDFAGRDLRLTVVDFVKRFGGQKAVEKMFSLLSKTATVGGCGKSSVSFAWISPEGKVHLLRGQVHPEWAQEYVQEHPALLQDMQRRGIQIDEMDVENYPEVEELLRLGWIRVSGAQAMSAYSETRPTQAAWDAAISIIVRCVVGGGLNPENGKVLIDYVDVASEGGFTTPVRFIEKFGSRQAVEKMFKTLMSRTAADQGCDLRYPSYGWISPEGKLYHLYGKVHEYWADKWVKSDFSEGGLRDKWDEWKAQDRFFTPYHTLLRLGWLKVSNAGSVQTWDESAVAQPAWDTMVSLVVSCIVDGGQDPEVGEVWVGANKGDRRLTPVEFVQKYGGRDAMNRMFRSLSLQSGSARVASKYLSSRETLNAQNLRRYFDDFLAAVRGTTTKSGIQKVRSLARQAHKYKLDMESPFLRMTQSGLRVAYRGCIPYETSYAWIGPNGTVYKCRTTHDDWAVQHVEEQGWVKGGYTDNDTEVALNLLYSKGYIRCSNFRSFESEKIGTPAQAWESAAAIAAECMRQDNVEQQVHTYQRNPYDYTKSYSVGDFIEKFGGRALVEKAFAKLNRSASRVASKYLTGAHITVPDGMKIIDNAGYRCPYGSS